MDIPVLGRLSASGKKGPGRHGENCSGPAHVQPGEVGASEGIVGNNFAVEHCRLGMQLAQQPRDRCKAVSEVVAMAAEDGDG